MNIVYEDEQFTMIAENAIDKCYINHILGVNNGKLRAEPITKAARFEDMPGIVVRPFNPETDTRPRQTYGFNNRRDGDYSNHRRMESSSVDVPAHQRPDYRPRSSYRKPSTPISDRPAERKEPETGGHDGEQS